MSIQGYRADIDGLRSIAVLFVLFFHLDISFFASGFIGVDVFFTISGFLITGIVLKDSQKECFSFSQFYIRRALRLLPAYLFLLIAVITISIIVLPPIAFDNMLQSAIASSFFVSNFYFLFEQGGYFSTAASELPLLHTWSLSVEEQFYLLMPLALVLWLKYCPQKYQLHLLVLILIFSVFFSYWLTALHQKAAYFFVLSRAHEFLLGSVLAVVIFRYHDKVTPRLALANVVFLISLGVLCLSAVVITNKGNFPGLLAIIPCLATCGIIYSGLNRNCLSHNILGIKPLVFIGLLSYSLYLWHWPIISFVKIIGVELSFIVQVVIVALSFSAAFFSWKFIETKVRYSTFSNKGVFALCLYFIPSIILLCLYFHAKLNNFYPQRFDENIVKIEKATKSTPETGRNICHNKLFLVNDSNCILGKEVDYVRNAILWGDSHANHFVGFIDELGIQKNMFIQDMTMGNCPPVISVHINAPGSGYVCQIKNKAVLNYILMKQPDVVFLAASWTGYLGENTLAGNTKEKRLQLLTSSLKEVVRILIDNHIEVVIFKTIPRSEFDLSSCLLKVEVHPSFNSISECKFSEKQNKIYSDNQLYNSLNESFGQDISYISVKEIFCQNNICTSYFKGFPLYRDTNHLNNEGSRLLGKEFIKQSLAD